MTTTFRRTLASAAAATALLASFALPSYAQTAAPAAPAAATTPKPERPMHKPGERREHMQQRIAKLKADLKLTPAQETAWNTYAATFKPGERPQRMEREDFAKLTTPQRIDKMREMRAQRAADADRRGEATKAFYAQLDANQQRPSMPPRCTRDTLATTAWATARAMTTRAARPALPRHLPSKRQPGLPATGGQPDC